MTALAHPVPGHRLGLGRASRPGSDPAASRRPAAPDPRPASVLPTSPDRPGYYRLRLVKAGPWIPAIVYVVDGERDDLRRLIEDQRLAYFWGDGLPPYPGPRWAPDWWPDRWPYHAIDEPLYRHALDLLAWARQWDPDHFLLHPRVPVDPATAPTW